MHECGTVYPIILGSIQVYGWSPWHLSLGSSILFLFRLDYTSSLDIKVVKDDRGLHSSQGSDSLELSILWFACSSTPWLRIVIRGIYEVIAIHLLQCSSHNETIVLILPELAVGSGAKPLP